MFLTSCIILCIFDFRCIFFLFYRLVRCFDFRCIFFFFFDWLDVFTFLASEVKGFDPARSLNHASMAVLDRGVSSQKLSLMLICCFFLAVSGNWLDSAFFLSIALK